MLTLQEARQRLPGFVIHQVYGLDKIVNTRLASLSKKQQNGFICVRCGCTPNIVLQYQQSGEVRRGVKGMHWDAFSITDAPHPRMFTLDHILPKSKGGTDAATNMRIMCNRCNSNRGNKITKEEWLLIFDRPHDYISLSPERFARFQQALKNEWDDPIVVSSVLSVIQLSRLKWPPKVHVPKWPREVVPGRWAKRKRAAPRCGTI